MNTKIRFLTQLLICSFFCIQSVWAQSGYPADYASKPRFKALIYYSNDVEPAHREFAEQALKFFHKLSYGEGFLYDKTTSLAGYTDEQLAQYDVQIWLNNSVHSEAERKAFERYMEQGGGWMGFHAAAYNDKNTRWPWYLQFLGGGVFYCNNWPPQPVLVETDTQEHPVTRSLPASFVMPSSEWYQWDPSPRKNPDVQVLASISQKNYPLGIKDIVRWGDFPVVWTNTRYRMVYLNIGHGDECFTDATTNLLYVNAFRWVAFPRKQVVVMAEGAGQHKAFTDVAIEWIKKECKALGVDTKVCHNADLLANDEEMQRTSLIIQLDYPPYTWPKKAEENFIRYMQQGKGGWIGFHHATLLGDFDGYPMWQWFSHFMGDIRFQNYVAEKCDATVHIEQTEHPVMKGVDKSFVIPEDEWYTYDKSPRLSPDIQVLASVDEDSYPASVKVKMGDHPVVWTNTSMPTRNLYIQMGHSPRMMESQPMQQLLRNAIKEFVVLW